MKKYRTNAHKLRLDEYIGVVTGKPWLIPVAILVRLLRLPIANSVTIHEKHDYYYRNTKEDIPAKHLAILESYENRLLSNGFRLVGYDHNPLDQQQVSCSLIMMFNSEEGIIALASVVGQNTTDNISSHSCSLASMIDDGTMLTSNNLRGMLPPPNFVQRKYRHGASIEELLEFHKKRLKEKQCVWSGYQIDAIKTEFAGVNERAFEYFLERGVYEYIDESEIEEGAGLQPPPLPPQTEHSARDNKLLGVFRRFGIPIIIFFMVYSFFPSGESPEDLDEYCLNTLSKEASLPLPDWLEKEGIFLIGNLDESESDILLRRWAKTPGMEVFIINPQADGTYHYSSTAVIRLPESPEIRKMFFKDEKRLLRWTGYDPYGDIGQEYSFLWID